MRCKKVFLAIIILLFFTPAGCRLRNDLPVDPVNADENVAWSLEYENPDSDLTGEAKAYIEQIMLDLMASNARTHGIFYGYEETQDNGESYYSSLVYAADVNNDGTAEMFSRAFRGGDDALKVAWYSRIPENYSDDEAAESLPPFTLQTPNGYYLKQMWFMPIGNKTVTFRLFQKDGESRFVLDACLYENKAERHLAVYKIQYTPRRSAPYFEEFPDKDHPGAQLKDPDRDRAFGLLAEEKYPALVKQYASPIERVAYGSENFPKELVAMMEEGLLTASLDEKCAALQTEIELLSKEEFLSETEPYFEADIWGYNDLYRFFDCYKADIDGDEEKEYVVFTSAGSGGFGDFDIYKLISGRMTNISESDFLNEAFNSLIRYDGKFYLVLLTYDYDTKITDGVTLFRIFSDGHDVELYINIEINGYKPIRLFRSDSPDSTQVCDYIEGVADGLFEYTGKYRELVVFVGDETSELTIEETSRLFSVGDRGVYYKIDYNNDGAYEYFKKHLIYPSTYYQQLYLATGFYELGSRVKRFDPGFGGDGLPYQLWYKDFVGKFYTFRLISYGAEYVLNAFLLEGDTMQQVCTYILFPESSLTVYEKDTPEFTG
jgi:hypothetical protein